MSAIGRGARAGLLACLFLVFAGAVGPVLGQGDEGGLHRIGVLPFEGGADIMRLLVDPALNRGVAISSVGGERDTASIYDLATLRLEASVPFGRSVGRDGLAVVDATNHRIFIPPQIGPSVSNAGCVAGRPYEALAIAVFDIRARRSGLVPMECVRAGVPTPDQFAVRGIAYHAPSNKLYVAGLPMAEFVAREVVTQRDRVPSMLLRQVDPATGRVEWELNLRQAGCDKMINNPDNTPKGDFGVFIARLDDTLITYCYGPPQQPSSGTAGRQGFVVKIPLDGDRLMPEVPGSPQADGNTLMRTFPTLPNDLVPLFDPGTGRILLLTLSRGGNGDAVWVFDAVRERFVGMIASGRVARGLRSANGYIGFDEVSGRLYYMNTLEDGPREMLIADVRSSPLPSGTAYPVEVFNAESPYSGPFVGVAPALRRVFVPSLAEGGFIVYEDTVPGLAGGDVEDPDAITDDIPEVEGRTGREYSAQATAYGAHVLNTGGIPRVADNRDPVCAIENTQVQAVRDRELGGCLADQLLTSGNRELFLAPTLALLGSSTGSTATASGAAFSTADNATDSDFRRAGSCFGDEVDRATERVEDGLSGPPKDGWRERAAQARDGHRRGCTAGHDALRDHASTEMREGTTGSREHPGRPVRDSQCVDDGEGATADAQPAGADGIPWSLVSSSSVHCDAGSQRTTGEAAANAFGIPSPANAALSVARAWSSVSTELTADGAVTTATAAASGVSIGGVVSIGEVRTVATTRARGRTGTARFTSGTTISEVRVPGFECVVCDYDEAIENVNRALGRYAVVQGPAAFTLATRKGAAAIVSKNPADRASDRTMNDDDTFQAAGLTVVLFNDGVFGRSRVVVALAGVQAESHYGVFSLGEGGDGGGGEGGGDGGGGGGTVDRVGGVRFVDRPVPGDTIVKRITRIVTYPGRLALEGLRLIVQRPAEAALLFVLWGLLLSPGYLFAKRRTFARAMPG